LRQAKENITFFHEKQLRDGFRLEKADGIVLGQKYTPIEKVGIYVPGGTAAYPSTVLMNAIPAKIAGVSKIIMTTPADKTGKIRDEILAAAKLCGVDAIYKCGGAQAIAALAYGTESIPAVHKIVGPGNIFVALAKRAVFGKVAIDMIAGPSEILVLADKTADPRCVAADLLSQAEHDKLATAVLVTDSRELALRVRDELEKQIPLLLRSEIARTSIDNNGKIILVESMERAIEISNEIAPEHLEVYTEEPFKYLDSIRNAGSIFLGGYTPEPMGDYFAGPNHTLPTGGSAKFSSPLSVDDFRKKSSYLYYTPDALRHAKDRVTDFAMREGLQAHAKSIEIRFEEHTK
jgi:histidinol dehydrogenase